MRPRASTHAGRGGCARCVGEATSKCGYEGPLLEGLQQKAEDLPSVNMSVHAWRGCGRRRRWFGRIGRGRRCLQGWRRRQRHHGSASAEHQLAGVFTKRVLSSSDKRSCTCVMSDACTLSVVLASAEDVTSTVPWMLHRCVSRPTVAVWACRHLWQYNPRCRCHTVCIWALRALAVTLVWSGCWSGQTRQQLIMFWVMCCIMNRVNVSTVRSATRYAQKPVTSGTFNQLFSAGDNACKKSQRPCHCGGLKVG